MKRSLLSTLSLLLALVMMLGAFVACDDSKTVDESTSAPADESQPTDTSSEQSESTDAETASEESESEAQSESETETDSNRVEAEGEHAGLINLTNSMANTVQAYFTDSKRTHYNLQNTEMTMSYSRSMMNKQLVASITNTKGNKYIENTMDVFVRMQDGGLFYASDSSKSAEANLYRFGYYYFQGIFEFQNFIAKDFNVNISDSIKAQKIDRTNQMSVKKSSDSVTLIIQNAQDPYAIFSGLSLDTAAVDTVVITAKATGNITSCQMFYTTTGGSSSFTQGQSTNFAVFNDGKEHKYSVSLSDLSGYSGNLTGIRLDPNGSVGDTLTITDISFGKADLGKVPSSLSINRHFHVYSDKMHHAVQFATLKETAGIEEIGMITKIPVSTVEKLLVIGEKDAQYTSLDGVDWSKVQSVGFDIKDAGIFGFILPVDAAAGNIKVTLEDDQYVIVQTRVPDGNKIIPSASEIPDKNGNLQHVDGVKNNGNDVYLAQRIYTDENHTFDEFVYETYCERNPIQKSFVKIGTVSDNASFAGYDPIRGIYVLNIATPGGGFYTPYNNPNKNYRVNFTITGGKDLDRDIYIMTSGAAGLLECAALLDDDLMMLPVPIEVIKNFSESTGERNLFNISDPTFSEAIFMLSLDAGEKYEYNILNLYQNWGKYPLKQISQIPFHCPYYHLSTGVTETNCILPWFGTAGVGKGKRSNTLPDFRSMSAPFWSTQPQHNSCGSHSWLEYTDADGKFSAVESTSNVITSFGPTYAEVVMNNLSDDGKIAVTYTHMEMPQLDENRVYYTMEYTVLEDVTINDFLHNFQFYGVTDNDGKGTYKRLGYLNEKNESVVVAANTSDSNSERTYLLGDECPYFSFFDMPDWNRESTSAEGYANLAFLVYNSSFVIGGEKAEPQFAIVNSLNHVRVTLNLDKVELKAGDRFTINAVLLPWGSQLLDGTYDEVQDQQVREVRRNTLLYPLTVASETDTVLGSPYLPRVKSADGKTAQFTLSGGENNVTVKAYGFEKLTAPKVEELVGGEWVTYELSSASAPDHRGNYHYYDGYCVQFEEDGTYSYSFVTTMTDGAPRTFRISAADDFTPWPEEIPPAENENLLKVYVDPEELKDAGESYKNYFASATMSDDGTYTTFTGSGNEENREAYAVVYSTSSKKESGQYFVIKYRVPSTNSTALSFIEIYTSTENVGAVAGDNFRFTPIADGEWHVAIVDISKSSAKTYSADSEGKYYAQYIRADLFNSVTPTDTAIDVAYIGIDSDLMEICKLESENFETVDYYSGANVLELDTSTGEPYVKTYIDPSSGYTQSDVVFAAQLDYVNKPVDDKVIAFQANTKVGMNMVYGYNAMDDKTLMLHGWLAAIGGINKLVWSADGGKTWNDCVGTPGPASDAIASAVFTRNALVIDESAIAACKKNGSFQASGIVVDLSAYAGQKVDLIFAAIPASDTEAKTLLVAYCFENVEVPQ